MGVFIRPPEAYVRQINLYKEAVADLAYGLHIRTKDPLEKTLEFVQSYVAFDNSESPTFDRPMLVLEREALADRKPCVLTFTEYLNQVIQGRLILTPSFTAYLPPDVKKSLISIMLEFNVQKRADAKNLQQKADLEGNKLLKTFYNNLQTAYKLSNNSSSGSHVSVSTFLYNLSAHPSLTATCRAATSYGNGSNEKFIAGNRHYHNAELVINNIVNICRLTNLDKVEECIHRYQLVIPTVEDVMECIQYSSDLYWKNDSEMARIREIVECLDDTMRAAVVYVSDFHHLEKHNSHFAMKFLKDISTVISVKSITDTEDYFSKLDGDQKILCSFNCFQYFKVKDIKSFLKDPASDPLVKGSIQATAKHILLTLEGIELFAETFWRTDNLPPDVARIPSIIRRTAVVSDTDSTIFTVQEWTKRATGKYSLDTESRCVAAGMIYISQQLIAHTLALMSANMGIPVENIFKIAMKNEYTFPVLSIVNRTKHYFAAIYAKEGVMYSNIELEKKGVGLRDAGVPKLVRDDSDKFIRYVINGIMTDCQLDFESVIAWVVRTEHQILSSLLSGEGKYLPTVKVKEASSYTAGDDMHIRKKHKLWKEVFSEMYGGPDEAPYSAFKVSLKGKSKTALKTWIERFPNQHIKQKFIDFCTANEIDKMTSVNVPIDVAEATGIPPEIVEGMNVRKTAYSMMMSYYLVLESLGVYASRSEHRLLSDFYPFESIKQVVIKPVIEH